MTNSLIRLWKNKKGQADPYKAYKVFFEKVKDRAEEDLNEQLGRLKPANLTRLRNEMGTREFMNQLSTEDREKHEKVMDVLQTLADRGVSGNGQFGRGGGKGEERRERESRVSEAEISAAQEEEKAAEEEEEAAKEEAKAAKEERREVKEEEKAKTRWRDTGMGMMAQPIAAKGMEIVGANLFIFLAALLWISDIFWIGFKGIDIDLFLRMFTFSNQVNIIRLSINSFVWVALIFYGVIKIVDFKDFRSFLVEYGAWALLMIFTSFLITIGGFGRGVWHLIFAYTVYFAMIRPNTENKAKANLMFAFLLFFDFFGHGIINYITKDAFVANSLIFPFWFYFAVGYTWKTKKNFFTKMIILVLVIVNVFVFTDAIPRIQDYTQAVTPEEREQFVSYYGAGIKKAWNATISFWDNLLNPQTYIDRGALTGETGEVTKPIAIDLRFSDATRKRFAVGKDISIAASVEREPDFTNEVRLKGSCTTIREGTGGIKEDIPGNLEFGTTLMPAIKGKEGGREGLDTKVPIRCRFEPKDFRAGRYDVKFSLQYSSSYQKTIFMAYVASPSVEVYAPSRLEESAAGPVIIRVTEPLGEGGILGKVPKIILPRTLELQPTPSEEGPMPSHFRMAFDLQVVPGAKIKNMDEVSLTLPMGISPNDEDCDYDLERGTEDNIYRLTKDALEEIKVVRELKFNCGFRITSLEEVKSSGFPKRHTISVGYTLEIEKTWPIEIVDIRTQLRSCTETCEDDDGCVCPSGCQTKKEGDIIQKGQSCD